MSAARNADVVRDIYEAFGRGDVPAILDHMHEDVAWESWRDNQAQRAGIDHFVPRHGRDGVAEFFAIVGQMEVHDFQVLDLLAGERQVAAEVFIDATLPTGGRLTDEELHLWTLDADGRVTRMRHYVDTAKHIAAARAAAPA